MKNREKLYSVALTFTFLILISTVVSAGQEIPLTHDGYRLYNPEIYGKTVVWAGSYSESVFVHDLTTGEETVLDGAQAVSATISGNKVAWSDNNGVFVYDISTKDKIQLSTGGSDPKVYGNIVVWYEQIEGSNNPSYVVYMRDLSTNNPAQIITNESVYSLDIYGDKIVWADDRNGEYYNHSIYVYNISTSNETQVTTINYGSISSLDIYGDRIVWSDYRNGEALGNVYMYDLSNQKETQITNNGEAVNPAIYGDRIVWQNYHDGDKSDIYTYDLSTSNETQISFSGLADEPAIYDDKIVWSDSRARTSDDLEKCDIYMYTISSDPIIKVGQGASTPEITQKFNDSYYRNGGLDVLGKPTTEVYEAGALGFYVQDFPGASGIPGGAIMYKPNGDFAYYIHGAIWQKYRYLDDVNKTKLGAVASDEGVAAIFDGKTKGNYTKFETGTIHWISDRTGENLGNAHRGQSFVTYGDLDDVYTKMGGTYSDLGFPIMDQEENDGYGYCKFEGGVIDWNVTENKYEVTEYAKAIEYGKLSVYTGRDAATFDIYKDNKLCISGSGASWSSNLPVGNYNIVFRNIGNYVANPQTFVLTTSGKNINAPYYEYQEPSDDVIDSKDDKTYYGNIIIPANECPDCKGNAIPIYVPNIVDNSNAIREDGDWRNVYTKSKHLYDFDWLAFLTGTITGMSPYDDSPYSGDATYMNIRHNGIAAGAEFFSAISNSANSATHTFDTNITVQKNSKTNELRAIVSLKNRVYEDFVNQWGDGKPVYDLDTGLTIIMDPRHKDGNMVYVSLDENNNNIIYTPIVYPGDKVGFRYTLDGSNNYIEVAGENYVTFISREIGKIESRYVMKTISPMYFVSNSGDVFQVYSPCDIAVYDSQSRCTGVVDGNLKEEIPNSFYIADEKKVVIYNSTDEYSCTLTGTDNGTYGLDVISFKDLNTSIFNALDIPVAVGNIHQYTVDWSDLSKGNMGISINIDNDNDGVFEKTIKTDNTIISDLKSFAVDSISLHSPPLSGSTWINWTWINPIDTNFDYTEIYLNNIFQTNTSAEYFNATGLEPETEYTISTRTVDINGNVNDTWVNSTAITLKAPITVEAGSDQIAKEGTTINFEGSFTASGSHTYSYHWDFGDGSVEDGSLTTSHIYADDGIYTVNLTLSDEEGNFGNDTLLVTVNNAMPVVDSGSDIEVTAGDPISFAGTFSDSGWLDTHTAEWNFGEGTIEAVSVAEENESPDSTGTVSGNICYFDAGSYTVILKVSDDDSGIGQDQATVTVRPIAVTVNLDPDTLNLGSGGNWVTAYIELPQGYSASNINIGSVLLNGVVPAVSDSQYGFVTNESEYLTDLDTDGISERMFKFNRGEVEGILKAGDQVKVTFTGKVEYENELTSGMASFEGSDVIKVTESKNKKG